jgi:hypothetical protein
MYLQNNKTIVLKKNLFSLLQNKKGTGLADELYLAKKRGQ